MRLHYPQEAVADAVAGNPRGAALKLLDAAAYDSLSHTDRLNLRLLQVDLSVQQPATRNTVFQKQSVRRIAIVSLLFNWPSTGGGIVHTVELAKFLSQAGYDVCHFYAVHKAWEIGQVTEQLPYNTHALVFDETAWNKSTIQAAFREAVDQFAPECVIVTDSWSAKPMLANAVSKYPYYLRLAALECICPLNNVRLIPGFDGSPIQCRNSQLANRRMCVDCVGNKPHASGPLHVAERQLACFAADGYDAELRSAFANAEATLVVNPLIAATCESYTPNVQVIPSGFDSERFAHLPQRPIDKKPFRLLFAGVISEYMKGFHVLFEACRELWNRRNDFELHVTSNDAETRFEAPFLRYRGWQSQTELPSLMADCNAVVVPTIAQEALGRTAVEAMGVARPVIAGRIGGLPFTVTEGLTGLLFEPGDVHGLAVCVEKLIDDPGLATFLGQNGHDRFYAEYTWQAIIEKKYHPLFEAIECRR